MTTKEEVMRLTEAAEVGARVFVRIDDLTKLIELAKQEGAAEEREACIKTLRTDIKLDQNNFSGLCQLQICVEAIRNRESK